MDNCNNKPVTIGCVLIPRKLPMSVFKDLRAILFEGKAIEVKTKRNATIIYKLKNNTIHGHYKRNTIKRNS